MPWSDELDRFVVPAGMTEAQALVVRRQLQVMSKLDRMEKKIDLIIEFLQIDCEEQSVGDSESDGYGRGTKKGRQS